MAIWYPSLRRHLVLNLSNHSTEVLTKVCRLHYCDWYLQCTWQWVVLEVVTCKGWVNFVSVQATGKYCSCQLLSNNQKELAVFECIAVLVFLTAVYYLFEINLCLHWDKMLYILHYSADDFRTLTEYLIFSCSRRITVRSTESKHSKLQYKNKKFTFGFVSLERLPR